jgi:hypothetical protein
MPLRMMPSRHSPFYSPFLITAGMLEQDGVEVALRLPAEGESPGALLRNGEVDVTQSAVSSAWTEIEKGATKSVHFAHINQRDGFFLVGREPDAISPGRSWKARRSSPTRPPAPGHASLGGAP